MIDAPRTAVEAAKITYGRTDRLHRGVRYNPKRCAYEVSEPPYYINSYQCSRKPSHGPEQLYCKQHARIIEHE